MELHSTGEEKAGFPRVLGRAPDLLELLHCRTSVVGNCLCLAADTWE